MGGLELGKTWLRNICTVPNIPLDIELGWNIKNQLTLQKFVSSLLKSFNLAVFVIDNLHLELTLYLNIGKYPYMAGFNQIV